MNYADYISEKSTNQIKWETSEKKNFLITCFNCASSRCAVSSEHGGWQCWACQKQGRFNELCVGLGIQHVGTYSEYKYDVKDSRAATEYLNSRGIPKHLVEDLKVDMDRDTIIFPYTDLYTGHTVGIKKKFLKTGKYAFEGRQPALYITDFKKYKSEKEVYVTEGEVDAISLYSLGYNTVALGGAAKMKGFKELEKFDVIWIVMDTDKAGEEAAERALEYFKMRGRIVQLSRLYKDPNEWLQEGGSKEKFEELKVVAELYKSNLIAKASDFTEKALEFLSNKKAVEGKPTGLATLDKLLGGGKRKGELTVLHATAKTGKNAFYHKLIYDWISAGTPVGYASRELSPESEVLPNLFSLKFKEDAWRVEMTEDRKMKYKEVASTWPLFFSSGYGYFILEDLTQWMKELHLMGVEYFFIDHLHYCLDDPEDYKQASKFSKQLKTLCKELNIHIDLIVQPNKLLDGQELGINSLKGGAAIGQALDNLLIMERESGYKNISKITLRVSRSRLATTGYFYLKYDKDTTDLIECKVERTVKRDMQKVKTLQDI